MGRVLTYLIEEEPTRALLGMRLRGIDHHLVFDGNESEGEFSKRFPETQLEMRGLYTLDEGIMSVVITHVPFEHRDHDVEGMFQEVLRPKDEF
jgi:hypothetical protein